MRLFPFPNVFYFKNDRVAASDPPGEIQADEATLPEVAS